MSDCTVIIVNWNGRDFLRACLDSLREAVDMDVCDVMVVDNASTDGSQAMMSEQYPWVRLLQLESNLGFAAANNVGISEARTPFVLLLNSDTEVTTEAIAGMIGAVKARPNVVVAGCEQVDIDGIARAGFGRFPSLKSEFVTMTGMFKWPPIRWLIWLRSRLILRRNREGATERTEPGGPPATPEVVAVDWVSGACMMLDRRFIQRLGCFDDAFFFYAEDIDLCMRARREGGVVGYMPGVQIVHYGGGSSQSNYMPLLRGFMVTRLHFFEKHHGRRSAAALRAVYCLAGLASVAKWSCAYALGRRWREDARHWLRFWLAFLAGGRGRIPLLQEPSGGAG